MKAAVILSLIAIAAAQGPEWFKSDDKTQPQVKYCCTPPQWEGIQAGVVGLDVGGRGQIVQVISKVAFDRDARKVYSYTNSTGSTGVTSIIIIQDFTTGYQWSVDVKKQQCVKAKVTQKFNNGCIPDDSVFNGNFVFGLGNESLQASSYTIKLKTPDTIVQGTFSVTQKQCVPLGELLYGTTNKIPVLLNYGFVNISPLKDPSIFTPPAICKKNATVTAEAAEHFILHF